MVCIVNAAMKYPSEQVRHIELQTEQVKSVG